MCLVLCRWWCLLRHIACIAMIADSTIYNLSQLNADMWWHLELNHLENIFEFDCGWLAIAKLKPLLFLFNIVKWLLKH